MSDFRWYGKYYVVKIEYANKYLHPKVSQLLRDIITEVHLREDKEHKLRDYIVVSNKEKDLFKAVKCLVEIFSQGK